MRLCISMIFCGFVLLNVLGCKTADFFTPPTPNTSNTEGCNNTPLAFDDLPGSGGTGISASNRIGQNFLSTANGRLESITLFLLSSADVDNLSLSLYLAEAPVNGVMIPSSTVNNIAVPRNLVALAGTGPGGSYELTIPIASNFRLTAGKTYRIELLQTSPIEDMIGWANADQTHYTGFIPTFDGVEDTMTSFGFGFRANFINCP